MEKKAVVDYSLFCHQQILVDGTPPLIFGEAQFEKETYN